MLGIRKILITFLFFIILWQNVGFSQKKVNIVLSEKVIITKDNRHNSFPSVVKLKNGEIIISYRKSNGHLSPIASAVYKSSLDNGKNYNQEIIVDNGDDFIKTKYGIRNLIINELSDGNLLATYWVNNGQNGSAYYRMSTDKGFTWGDRREIKDDETCSSLVGIEGKIIEINNDYILPVFIKMDINSKNMRAGVMISSDLLSWTFYEVSRKRSNNNESTILLDEKQNEIIYFYRNVTENALYRSISKDVGRTWSEPENVSFSGYVQSRPDVAFYPDKDEMYLLYREGKYQTGAIAISHDKGNTWERVTEIQKDSTRFTYGSMARINRNKSLLIYSSEKNANGESSSIKSRLLRINKKSDGE
tara:strand:+ start:33587 stop:34669 length:1083 start_codon:yes stop_codon:yes gene_type:complete